jgi:methionine sulfoxide reductase heme-binding subunit
MFPSADPDAQVGAVAAFSPFGSNAWLATGTFSVDLLAAVVLTSLGRRRLNFRAWRVIHWSVYAAWPLAVAHTIAMGTDISLWRLETATLASMGAVGALVAWRVLPEPHVHEGRRTG